MWNQFQANAANQGFVLANTRPAITPRWFLNVGPVAFASPVIGPDGTIYIGNLAAELIAISPDGNQRWRKLLDDRPGSIISGAPAVSQSGHIYVITTYRAKVRDHRIGDIIRRYISHSRLHCVDANGTLLWSFIFPNELVPVIQEGSMLSAPKIIGHLNPIIFISATYTAISPRLELFAINDSGNLIQRIVVSNYPLPTIIVDGGFIDILDSLWDFLDGVEFEPSGGGPTLQELYGWQAPSIAIADFGAFANDPVIVVDDHHQQLSAFRFQNNSFIPLWNKSSTKQRKGVTPAIFLNSTVAVGQENGELALYDLLTGDALWKPWYKAPHPIQSSATSFLNQIYLVASTSVIALEGGGRLIKEFKMSVNSLGAALGSPAMSANFVYVNAQEGLFSFSLDLKDFTKNSIIPGGVSSPAIAEDGTVYAMGRNEILWAFVE